jgi:hypothetical protein
MVSYRLNALNQALDIAGSLFQTSTLTLADEMNGLGSPLAGQIGASASVTTVGAGNATITGLTGMSVGSVGMFLTLSGASSSGNNGTFLIDSFISATSVTVSNPSAVASDGNNGSIAWTERNPYSLQDDLNYERTDRSAIKGVGYDAPIPTYQRPTAVGTNVPANLSNIATKTTDAVAYNVNRAIFGIAVQDGYTQVTISSAGSFKHADPVDQTGVPCFDSAPFTGDWASCYVHVVDGYNTGDEMVVLSGPHAGERIFGVTYAGASVSPNSVEVHFYSSPFPDNYTVTNTPYTWESGQALTVNFLYGYSERLDLLDVNAFRTVPALGILTDASNLNEINDLVSATGIPDGYNSLAGLLTDTSQYYPFYFLPNATPTVVQALNTLNSQIGNETYTGPILTSGQTITASLQALSNAISATTISRTIEVLSSSITPGTPHTLPAGLTYTVDNTGNGRGLYLYTRGVLRHPQNITQGGDYMESSATTVTFYATQNAGDIIDYFIV